MFTARQSNDGRTYGRTDESTQILTPIFMRNRRWGMLNTVVVIVVEVNHYDDEISMLGPPFCWDNLLQIQMMMMMMMIAIRGEES